MWATHSSPSEVPETGNSLQSPGTSDAGDARDVCEDVEASKLESEAISPELPAEDDVALSLSGSLDDNAKFEEMRVTFEQLSQDPLLMSSPKLVCRIGEQIYSWKVGQHDFS